MVTRTLRFFLAGVLPLAASAQVVNIDGGLPGFDSRPIGKYLVEVCTIRYADFSVPTPGSPPPTPGSLQCDANKAAGPAGDYRFPAPAQLTPQKLTLKQVGCLPGGATCPATVYPLTVGSTMYVQAESDSGLPAVVNILSGQVVPVGGTGNVTQYTVNGLGTVVLQATQPGDAQYAPAVPVQLILPVTAAGAGGGDSSCKGLLPASGAANAQPEVDAATLVSRAGNPVPFTLETSGSNTILIYSTREPLTPSERRTLNRLPGYLAQLAGRTADQLATATVKPFKVEVQIPHAAALGDLATRISTLNYSDFTVQDIGAGAVRITAKSQPDCSTWTAFLDNIRRLVWSVSPEPPTDKLYFLSAGDAVSALNTAGFGPSSGGGSPAATNGGGGTPATGGTPAGGGASSPAGSASISVTQPAGSAVSISSNTTPALLASGAAPSASASSGGSAAAAPASSNTPAAPKPPGIASLGTPTSGSQAAVPDLIVFNSSPPGDDAAVLERKRILALLDLPRPEMIVNAWVMQNSTASPVAIGAFASAVRELVGSYNDAIEQVILRGWQFLEKRTHEAGYFDEPFYHYIADRFIGDRAGAARPSEYQAAVQDYLESSPGTIKDSNDVRTLRFGLCPAGQYCLGYTGLFQPLKPRLTDFLLTLIAAADAKAETKAAIDNVERRPDPVAKKEDCDQFADKGRCRAIDPIAKKEDCDQFADKGRCRAIWSNLGFDQSPLAQRNCTALDYTDILASMVSPDPLNPQEGPRVFLHCFRDAAKLFMPQAGHLRAAIADFLFYYKFSQQYPHEFPPYGLSQSADALNTALSPLIDAFNRDIVAYQTFMRADVQERIDRLNNSADQRCCIKRLFGIGKPSFFNDGLVTVRTISGVSSQVNTTSQSALNVSTAPQLSTLLNNLNAAPGSASALASVLGTATAPPALLAGVLSSFQTTYAQIGRQLNLTVLPRSLSTASSAEMNVTLQADEVANGTTFSGGPTGGTAPNYSRVASHDTTTRIRVESVKLFEVSSFAAILQKSRSKFPLLPPFVEIPYIGTILGVPIPGAKEYHSSIAIMSAMVVPTAADIAYGLTFRPDEVVSAPSSECSLIEGSAGAAVTQTCKYSLAVARADLKHPVERFHRSLVRCFAGDMRTPIAGFANLTNTDPKACRTLTFDTAF